MSNKAFAINTANAVNYLTSALSLVLPPDDPMLQRSYIARMLTRSVTEYIQRCEAWRKTYNPSLARNCTSLRGIRDIEIKVERHINYLMQTRGNLPFTQASYEQLVERLSKVREWIVDAVAEYISVEEWQVCYTKAHTTTVTVEVLGDYRILDWEYRRSVGEFVHDGELTEAHINRLVTPKGLKVKRVVDTVALPTDEIEGLNAAGDVMDVTALEQVSDLGGDAYFGRNHEIAQYARRNNSDVLLTQVVTNPINSRRVGLFDDLHSSKLVGYASRTPAGNAPKVVTAAFGNYPEIARRISASPQLRATLKRMGWDGDISKFTEQMAGMVIYGMHPEVYQYFRPINQVTGLQNAQDDLPTDHTTKETKRVDSGFRFTAKPRTNH